MKKFYFLLSLIVLFNFSGLAAISECKIAENHAHLSAQTNSSPLNTLILNLQEVKKLIEEGDNKAAIVILKSSLGQVRKVKEFNKRTKQITEKRIKKRNTIAFKK